MEELSLGIMGGQMDKKHSDKINDETNTFMHNVRRFRRVGGKIGDLAPLNKTYGAYNVYLAWIACEILDKNQERITPMINKPVMIPDPNKSWRK